VSNLTHYTTSETSSTRCDPAFSQVVTFPRVFSLPWVRHCLKSSACVIVYMCTLYRRLWARRLCERVRDPRWVHAQFSRDVTDDEISRDVNIFFIKLHLLDPSAVLPAFNSLTKGTHRHLINGRVSYNCIWRRGKLIGALQRLVAVVNCYNLGCTVAHSKERAVGDRPIGVSNFFNKSPFSA